MEKKGNALFQTRPRMKAENGRNTSNTGSKGYVWPLVRWITGIASKTRMLSVEAVWVMPSVTGCHTLSTPIRKAKHNTSDGGTTRCTFATSFNGAKPKENMIHSTKSFFKFFRTSHKLSMPWQKQKSRRLGFEKKNQKLWNWQKFLNNFNQFRHQKTRLKCKQGQFTFRQFFCETKYQYCYTSAVSETTTFKKRYPLAEGKIMANHQS